MKYGIIICMCFGIAWGGFGLRLDSASVVRKLQKLEELKGRARDISQRVDRGFVDQFIGNRPPPRLIPPEELFRSHPQRTIRYGYSGPGRHVTKKDLNRIVDSLTNEFAEAFSQMQYELSALHKVSTNLLDQSEGHNNRWESIMNLISGGSLVSLITAIGGLIVMLKKKKKDVNVGSKV